MRERTKGIHRGYRVNLFLLVLILYFCTLCSVLNLSCSLPPPPPPPPPWLLSGCFHIIWHWYSCRYTITCIEGKLLLSSPIDILPRISQSMYQTFPICARCTDNLRRKILLLFFFLSVSSFLFPRCTSIVNICLQKFWYMPLSGSEYYSEIYTKHEEFISPKPK